MSDTGRGDADEWADAPMPPDDEPGAPGDEPGAPGADALPTASATGGALLRRAHDALTERGQPMPVDALVPRAFGASAQVGGSAAPWARMLDGMLRASALFACDARGLWRLAAWDAGRQMLAAMEFAVLDVETTGLAPGRHRLIEVAMVLVRDGALGDSYSRLINPERRIPQFITSFTGIRQGMVNRARKAAAVLPEARAFLGDRIIVGHNVGFDLSFLAYESERVNLALGFPEVGLDTIALARRYLTGMRRVGLDRVAAALHVPVRERHRALPDAQITAKVFLLLLARARAEGCETLEDLYRALDGVAPVRGSGTPRRLTGSMYLNPAWRQTFPAQPGVYLMKDAAGEVIYVGKAKCLRDRLASYYSQPLGYTRKMDGLLQSVQEIETRVLGSELEALLVESQLIKQLQPRYNVQLRNYEHYPFIKVDVQHAYPRFYATREISADGARYFGPFRSGRIVDATLELIQKVFPIRTCIKGLPPHAPPSEPCLRYHLKRCPAPCRGLLSDEAAQAYRTAVDEACAFLGGERDDLIDRLKREMFEAAARQDFERAARLRDALKGADQVLLGQRLVTGAVEANNLLIVYPSAEPEHLELYLIRHGRLVAQRRTPNTPAQLETDLRALAVVAEELGTPPGRVGKAEVDQINILARWISHHSEDDDRAFFRLPRNLADLDEVTRYVGHVMAAAAAREESEKALVAAADGNSDGSDDE
ncbi:MAG: exonuclease domain-containing protein [Ktedonobacterales bacterium]